MNGAGALAELFSFRISGLGVAAVVVVGALLYALLRALRTRLRRLPLGKRHQALVSRVRTLVEAAIGAAYVVWAVGYVLGDHPLYTTIALALLVVGLVVVTWGPIRDVVAGLLLKASDHCVPGDLVEVGGVAGRVKGLGYRAIAIELPDGRQAIVPYGRISRETLLRKPATDAVFAHVFSVRVAPGVAVVEARETIRRAAILSHWHSVVREPRVEVGDDGTISVTLFAIAPGQGHCIEDAVRRALVSSRR
jgi:small-conductance mechanosensitive channel